MLDDLRWSARSLRRQPGFAAAVVFTLAIGVGANAAIFSVLDRVFFQAPSGIVDPGSVRRVYARLTSRGSGSRLTTQFGVPEMEDLAAALRGRARVAGYSAQDRRLGDGDVKVRVGHVTSGFLELLGTRPSRGRFFLDEENRYGDPRPVAVLGDALWRRVFAANPAIIGRTVVLDDAPFTVVGIAARGFEGVDLDVVDLWVPIASNPAGSEGALWRRGSNPLGLVVRLETGSSRADVEAGMTMAYRRGNSLMPWADPTAELITAPLLIARGPIGFQGVDERNIAIAVRLSAVAILILIIATSNVASLLLMRALRRRREIAVRLALGMSRARLIGQLLTESVFLAALAGGVAVLTAQWAGAVLRTMLLSRVHWTATVIDHRLVIGTMVVAIVAGFAAGLAPISLALKPELVQALKSASPEAGAPRTAIRVWLLVTQAALCMILLSGAGVFVQSLHRANTVDMGFDRDELITVSVQGMGPIGAQWPEALERMQTLPGVAAVGAGALNAANCCATFQVSGRDSISGRIAPWPNAVDGYFFKAAGLRIVAGRGIATTDVAGAPPVAVITESVATSIWAGRNPLGDCFYMYGRPPCRVVVGVMRDLTLDFSAPVQPQYFIPLAQHPVPANPPLFGFVVRMRGPATGADVAALQSVVDPLLTARGRHPAVRRLSDRLDVLTHPWRIAAILFVLCGAIALISAGAGVYGLVAYDATSRTREMGIRITLGATSASILRLVLAGGVRVVLLGVVVGGVSAIVSGRALASLLFDTAPADPIVLALAGIVLTTATVVASIVPAWRATRVDPVVALRAE